MIQKNWTPPWTFESKTKKKTEMLCSKWWPTSTRIGITLMCTWCKVVELEKIHKPAMSSTSSRLTICTPPFRPFLKVPKPLPPANIWLFTTSCTASPHYWTYFASLLLILVLFIVQTNQVQENWPNQSRQSPWTWPAWQDTRFAQGTVNHLFVIREDILQNLGYFFCRRYHYTLGHVHTKLAHQFGTLDHSHTSDPLDMKNLDEVHKHQLQDQLISYMWPYLRPSRSAIIWMGICTTHSDSNKRTEKYCIGQRSQRKKAPLNLMKSQLMKPWWIWSTGH